MQLRGRFLLMEVESDRFPSPEQIDRSRRKEFYRRLGCREIEGLRGLMPPVTREQPPPMEMLVHSEGLPEAIEKERLRRWLAACYEQVYGVAADDPRIEAMLRELPESVRLI